MTTIDICGGRKLNGEIEVQGSKNAVLPILAATILSGKESVIHNCPRLSDVFAAFRIIESAGGKVSYSGGTAVVNTEGVNKANISDKLMSSMRSSILFAGSFLPRLHSAVISRPGGCAIGLRPVDMHLRAFRKMGAQIDDVGGLLYMSCDKLKGAVIDLPFPSVGATENIMLSAVLAEGETVITNAACEPEITELQSFLNAMGAKVFGAGSKTIRITGVEKLEKVEYNIVSDRIFAATVMCAAACCGGDVTLKNARPEHMRLMLSMLRDMACTVETEPSAVRIIASERSRGIGKIITAPYPGFPTDAQALFMAALATADGTSVFVENVFESRYKHAAELSKMGADIIVDGRIAVVSGTNYIQGTKITASDLRGGAALVVAGLCAIGDTSISGVSHIDRGYECIEETFSGLGARIKRTQQSVG